MQLVMGDVKITTIVEQPLIEIEKLIPDVVAYLPTVDWLKPHYVDDCGIMKGLVQAFVIETSDKKIMVDTCVGNEKNLEVMAHWHQQHYPFLERLAEAGYSPEDIDIVLCTHLHLDHIGWNTYKDGDVWKPTFPNAEYLFARVEYEGFMAQKNAEPPSLPNIAEDHPDYQAQMMDYQVGVVLKSLAADNYVESIQPVFDAGLVTLVETDHQVCEQVSLLPTHGHSVGHVSILVQSADEKAVITGDAIHHPVQMAYPEISPVIDHDGKQAAATRKSLLDNATKDGTRVFGSHFCEPNGCKVLVDGKGYRFDLPDRD